MNMTAIAAMVSLFELAMFVPPMSQLPSLPVEKIIAISAPLPIAPAIAPLLLISLTLPIPEW